ncbi:MAG: HelD family protein, partial [Flavobacteriales bacterium]
YFGRIDFTQQGDTKAQAVYIGIHAFLDEEANTSLVYDWRSPISSMFYDHELGEAHYETPGGRVEGRISLKRQYRIRDGRMEYMLDSGLHIHDDILQQELQRASSARMRNIVATIQREQNAVIRNTAARALIIQGVAGSGKTSIALHRIAFLLYRFKDTLSSDDILILSPNRVFAHYIGNVLPELGEEDVPQTTMEALATRVLGDKVRFQGFLDQVARQLEKPDPALEERIAFKADPALMHRLDEYVVHLENTLFTPRDLAVRGFPIPDWFLRERYEAQHRTPLLRRGDAIVRDVLSNVAFYFKYEAESEERQKLKADVLGLFGSTNLRALYKGFYEWLGRPELLRTTRDGYEYNDVYPLIYLKARLEGLDTFSRVKHLIVDEMQDHTPLQYAILARLFPCPKTILGDIGQAMDPAGASDLEAIRKALPDSE